MVSTHYLKHSSQTHVRANFGHFYNFTDIPLDRSAHINTCGDTSSYTNNVSFNNSPSPKKEQKQNRALTSCKVHMKMRVHRPLQQPIVSTV